MCGGIMPDGHAHQIALRTSSVECTSMITPRRSSSSASVMRTGSPTRAVAHASRTPRGTARSSPSYRTDCQRIKSFQRIAATYSGCRSGVT